MPPVDHVLSYFFFVWAFKQLYFPTKVWRPKGNDKVSGKNYFMYYSSTSVSVLSVAMIRSPWDVLSVEKSTSEVCTSSFISSPTTQISASSMANANFRGRYLHEGASNLRSSKEFTGQFVSVLSNGEGLSAIWASLNFWSHCELSCVYIHTRVYIYTPKK